jgi:uncharacterized protein (DUF433 family)
MYHLLAAEFCDAMLKQKPSRRPGQDLRTVPTFTIPEAAGMLAIRPRTMFSWYERSEAILRASGNIGSIHLLSYKDLEEAYRVFLLRERFHFSLQFLRKSMSNARKMFRSQHPLHRADSVMECLSDLVYDKPARGGQPRTVTSLGLKPGQQLVEEVANLFGARIVAGKFIFPWRYAATDQESRPVSMNPEIMSGRLVVTGTRIPVAVLSEEKRSGSSAVEIARDYGLEREIVEKALIHVGLRQKAA